MTFGKTISIASLACALAFVPVTAGFHPFGAAPAMAAEIKVVVNDEVVTSYDIAKRTAFLKLQRRKGNLNSAATEELTDEALKRSALRSAGIRIPDSMVDSAYANFAKSNNLSTKQLGQILGQAGVTAQHFKEFIRIQIGWGQFVQARAGRQNGLMSEQDVVAKMLEQGGAKPTSTEYLLQQVIFVVPQGKSKKARMTEANNMRARTNDCGTTVGIAKNLRDVTVRDLGRVLELQLPDEWSKDIKGLKEGQTTRVKETARGLEFILVCRARNVSDDRVAQLEFSTKQLETDGGDLGERYLKELRDSARIQRR